MKKNKKAKKRYEEKNLNNKKYLNIIKKKIIVK